jgi:ABC-type antimicrobial peptide transport system permease subunit
MALGIVWGMACVMVLLAVANGFEASQRRALSAYGDRFLVLRLNRAELDRAAGGEERRLHMDADDIERLRMGAPAIRHLSPMNMAYRARITGLSGAGSNVMIAGALPEIALLRHIPLVEGRFFDETDQAERRRVIVLGPMARKQLFGGGPAVGQKVRIAGFSRSAIASRDPPKPEKNQSSMVTPFASRTAAPGGTPAPATPSPAASAPSTAKTSSGNRQDTSNNSIGAELFEVIGVLADVETQKESYVSVARMAFVPFSTSIVVFDRRYSTIFIEPRSIEDRDLALRQFREVMGARYGFEPEDRNAVVIYFDAIERARSITAIFGGIRLLLTLVGSLILGIGAMGVMNVVLVSIASRTFEIGLRKALGATPLAIYAQFFFETILACFASGALGFLLGTGGIALLSGLPLPEGFSKPVLDFHTALLSFGILTTLAVLSGVYPARRAARLQPVAALQTRGT